VSRFWRAFRGNSDSDYDLFEAAHVFPIAHQETVSVPRPCEFCQNTYTSVYVQWAVRGFAGLMTDDHPTAAGANKINSLENGMLLLKEVHVLFDTYRIGIDPDVGPRSFHFLYLICELTGGMMVLLPQGQL
jgi:hypothetical protein